MRTILILLFSFLFIHCNNDDDDGYKPLPPATQTGEGTFACYVDGKAFIDTSGGWFNCYYQYVDGGYHFAIGGDDENNLPLWAINLGTNSKTISEGEELNLNERTIHGNAWGEAGFSLNSSSYVSSGTNQELTGKLFISKLDFENHIVSGTFWFDIIDPFSGDTIQIRQGRFDTLFTQ